MNKSKAIIVTIMFMLLFGAVLQQICIISAMARLIVLLIFAVPTFIALGYMFYEWIMIAAVPVEEQEQEQTQDTTEF